MKIVKFRIKNYKSIIDSGDCYLDNNITILAGKNESGKTAILEALEDFDTESKIRDKAIPIEKLESEPKIRPEIKIEFQIDKDTLNEIFDKIELERPTEKIDKIEIVKKYPDQYSLSPETSNSLNIKSIITITNKRKQVKKWYDQIGKIINEYNALDDTLPVLDVGNIINLKPQVQNFSNQIPTILTKIPDEKKKTVISENTNRITEYIPEMEKYDALENKFIEEIKNYIPYFILFSSFDDVFPSEIHLDQAQNNELIKDLDLISNLNIELIKTGAITHKAKHKEQLNVRMKKEYARYWTQDLTNLHVDWDSNNLQFFIKEGNNFYPPDLRSKGKQWHLSFYIRVAARAKADTPNVILIDEPGLFLHAKAQKDVLKILEDSSAETPVIFSTHSPYLLEPEKFSRIRLITRDSKKGTTVENKIHKVADKETLTPILTAIGLGLSSSIENIEKIKNVVVEGASDQYYLQAFKNILKRKPINFVFGGGSGNMPIVGTILTGWGCRVLYLYDNDKGKRDAEKNLKRKWLLSKSYILSVSDEAQEGIEDIFEPGDFKKYVLEDESLSYVSKNSEYMIKAKKEKVLAARQFFIKATRSKLSLSERTLSRARSLFEKIEQAFETNFKD